MSERMKKLKTMIKQGVGGLISTQAFSGWFKEAKATDGDIVVINNSFIYRKPLIKTSKNEQYLCLKVKGGRAHASSIFVGIPGDLNSDFKLFSAKSRNLPALKPLDEALKTELNRLQRLVFLLIGELKDVSAEVEVKHSLVKKLRFDPSATERAALEDGDSGNRTIVVNELTDPVSAWNVLRPQVEREVGDGLSSLESAFAAAFEKLQEEARLRLILPSRTASKAAVSFIARLRESVSEQHRLYQEALQQYEANRATDHVAAERHLREAMRIGYNFAEDAIKVLQLLVSIADLKGVLLWCTIKEHFDLAEAFRNLPWTKSHKKPSLEHYREIISGARNRAFHSLLAFDRTIEANLEGVEVRARRLTLLPPYRRRKAIIPFDYEDREIVEILTELTRAPEVTVPFDFWKKNEVVMKRFEELLDATERALWILNEARSN